jgi:hypothetical protein
MDTVPAYVDWRACMATLLSVVSGIQGSSKTPATDQTLSLHFHLGWSCVCGFIFYDNSRIKGSYSCFLFSQQKSSRSFINNQPNYVQILYTDPYSRLHTGTDSDEKGCLLASIFTKKSAKQKFFMYLF